MSNRKALNLLVVLAFLMALLPAPVALAAPTAQEGEGPAISAQPSESGKPSAPPQVLAHVDLILDDGSVENNVGINDSVSAYQFIWFNRFTPGADAFPFDLEQIQVFFDTGVGVTAGDAIDLVVYEDADGDPTNGATLLATINETVQFADGTNWSVYNLATPVTLNGPGDVLIGVIDRFVDSGVTPANYPAAIDTTSSQGRSWIGWWNADPPDPAVLPPDLTFDVVDNLGISGNWMIRGAGTSSEEECEWEVLLDEGFESSVPPAGWGMYETGAVDDPGWVQTDLRVHTGDWAAYHNDDMTTGDAIAWLVSPQLSLGAAQEVAASFWQNENYASWYTYHGLWVSTASCDPNDGDFVELTELGPGTEGTWEEIAIDLSAYLGSDVCFAFRYEGNFSDEWYVDDVYVEACVNPPLILTPDEQGGAGCMGSDVNYEVVVNNYSGADDTYDVTYDGNAWDTVVDPATLFVANGLSGTVDVTVTIPDYVFEGDSDLVTLEVASQADPSLTRTATIETFAGNVWVPTEQGGGPALWPAYASDGTSFFYFDGKDETGAATDQVQIFTPGSGWSTGTGDGDSLYGSVAGYAADGNFYVAGGFEDGQVGVDTLKAYDPAADAWTTLTSMPEALGLGGGGVSDGTFLWVGGSPDSGLLDYTPVYLYDIATDSWSAGTSLMDVGLTAPGYAIADGVFYVGGNYLGDDVFYAYDVDADTWTQLADLPADAGKVSPLFIYDGADDVYLVAGGLAPSEATDYTYRYSISEDAWYDFADLNWATLGNGGGLADGMLYTFGGGLNVSAAQTDEGLTPHEYALPQCPAQTTAVLSGNVTNGVSGDPIEGALVEAEGTGYTVLEGTTPYAYTDVNGDYELILYTPADYDLTASYGDFDPKMASLSLPAEGATQDFVMGPPVANPSPTDYDVTLPWGEVQDEILTLANDGYSVLNFEFVESDGGGPVVVGASELAQRPPIAVLDQKGILGKSPSPAPEGLVPNGPQAPQQYDVELAVDDGSAEDAIGLTSGGQLIWLNRFTPDPVLFPFTLQQISVIFGDSVGIGDDVQILVFEDTDGDGDPGTGANLLYSQDVTVQFNDYATWNDYLLDEPLLLEGPGDVILGAINRSGMSGYLDYPAAIDEDAPHYSNVSWIGYYGGPAPEPPYLPAPDLWGPVESFGFAGNWTLRGYGVLGGGEIIWLTEDPVSGTVDIQDSIPVSLTFDAAIVPALGTYTGTLTLNSDDPDNPSIDIPVALTVVSNPDAGKIQGTITSDRPGGPIAGATVDLESVSGFSDTLTTDENGYYERMILPEDLGTFTVTVSAPDYVTDEQLVTVSAPGPTVHDVELKLDAPRIGVDPTELYQTLVWGEVLTDYVDISNTGQQDLDFDVFMPASVLLYEDFEDWLPAGWTIVNNGGNCVWESTATTGRGNNTGGTGYAADADSDWCGSGTTMDTELWTPMMDLSDAAGAQLSFAYDYWNFANEDWAYVDVSPDGGQSWVNVIAWNEDLYGPRTEVVDLTPFVGNPEVIVRFHYVAPGWDWYWVVDDVLVETFVPKPWLNWTPTTGTVPTDTIQVMTITKDSALVPQPGVYEATLLVESNDPLEPMIPISITMDVADNPDQARFYGTVLGNRTPEGANTPLEDVLVTLIGPEIFETWTDENGFYEVYLLPSQLGDYLAVYEKPGYITEFSALFPIGPGDNIEHNVTLRLLAPMLEVVPEMIQETLPWGGATTVPMSVTNPSSASARLNVSMFEIMPTFTPLPVQTVQLDLPASPERVLAEGVVLDDASAPAAPARSVDVKLLNLALEPLKVLIISDDANQGALGGLDDLLNLYPDIEADVWYDVDGFPTLADLMPYQAVIVGGRYAFSNAGADWTAEALGNLMADYVDMGGGVIMIQNAWLIDDVDGAQYALGGRFQADYSPVDYQYSSGETYTYADRALGVYMGGHPLMEDVGFIVDHMRAYTDLMPRPYAEQVAFYDDGELYVATNPGKVVLLNQVLTFENNWEGDVPTLLHNAIVYLAPNDVPWLDETVTEFDLPVGATDYTDVSLDAAATDLGQPGIYGAWLWFANNDPFQQGAYVPVQMTVEPDPTMGQLRGTVYLNRAAAGENVPADGAQVVLDSAAGTVELTTQPDGTFTYYYLAADLPTDVTVTASQADYQDDQVVAPVSSGALMTVELTLELLAPWIQVSPTALDLTMPPDDAQTLMLDVENLGLTDLIIPLIQEIPATATLPLQGTPGGVTWVDAPFTVDAEVENALQTKDGTTDFFIWMRERADLSRAYGLGDKSLRRQYAFDTLTATAERSQAEIRNYLDSRGLEYDVFWINNSILVHGGDQAVVEAMRARGDVYRIRGVYTQMHIPDPEQLAIVTLAEGSLTADPTWNIDIVNAPQVWDQLNVTGAGVVVSNIDTGVRYTHEALDDSYRGNLGSGVYDHNYNWGSIYGNGPTACPGAPVAPCDWAGHGSHTMGTMVGGDGNGPFDMDIGMAPDAKWMACMGCDTPPNQCSDAALTGCAQWVVAPLDLDGLNPDPTLAPDVVNNSWGGGGEDDWYYSFVEAWHAADIIPVFSAGNEGSDCDTLGSPGSYDNVIGMGGTDNADNNYTFSSRGPGSGTGVFPVQKPDLAAPAEGVPSSTAGSDSSYAQYSGTSMAAPHMAGLVALMRSVDPNITFEKIWDIATSTTVTDTLNIKNGTWCGAGPDFPNYVFGYGRIDAFAAMSEVAAEMDIPWLSLNPVSGTVGAAGTMPVEVNFDSTGLEPGVYTGTLRVLHNDPLTGEMLVPVQLTIEPLQPTFSIVKTVAPADQDPGEPVTYTIVFGNQGDPATGVVVSDVLPAEVEYASSDPMGTYDAIAHELVWGPMDLATGEFVTATVVVTIGAEVMPSTWMTNSVYLFWNDQMVMDEVSHHVSAPFHYYYLPIVVKQY